MSARRIEYDLHEATYHSGPELSSTGARRLLESPAKFRYLQDHGQEHKDAFDLGTAVHSKVLGTGSEVILLDFDSFRSKASQDARDLARQAGKVALLRDTYQQVEAMAEAVLAHPTARALFEQEGTSETSVYTTDHETGVAMRARFDYLPDLASSTPIAVDLKTTGKSASKRGFERSVVDFGYDVQESWYVTTLGVEMPFLFVVVETAAPYLVAVHQLDAEFHRMGKVKTRRALDLYAACQAEGIWPGYPEEVQLISPPTWAVYKFEEAYA
jgi:hypothetical protein